MMNRDLRGRAGDAFKIMFHNLVMELRVDDTLAYQRDGIARGISLRTKSDDEREGVSRAVGESCANIEV